MPLQEDRIRALEARTEIPDGGVQGTVLAWMGTDEEGDQIVAWNSFLDGQIIEGNGDPNGNVYAPMGKVYDELDAPGLWQNTDGAAAWRLVGTGGGNLITDSYYSFSDDASTTGKLYTAGSTENLWVADSGKNNGSDVSLSSGLIVIQTTGVYSIAATWGLIADAGGTTYTMAQGWLDTHRTHEPGSPVHQQTVLEQTQSPVPLVPSSGNQSAQFSASFTGFMYASDQPRLRSRFMAGSAPGSTWSYNGASMQIERLA